MTFLPHSDFDNLGAEAKAAWDRQVEAHGDHRTNLRATLLGHAPSFDAYMRRYTLRDDLIPFIGERAVRLFSYAISDASDALICSTHYRRVLVDSGENPDAPQVTEAEQLLIDWGRLIATTPAEIPDAFYDRLEAAFNPQLRLLLLAYAGQLVATNVLTTVGRVELDAESYDYRRPGDTRTR